MKIDKNLNIVMRLTDEDGNPVIIHHTPLQSLVFESNWKIFREAYDDLSTAKSMAASAVLAKRIFLEAGETLGKSDEARDILNQIAGATFIYQTEAQLLDQAKISDELKEEILSRLVFFICYRLHVFPSMLKGWLTTMKAALNLELTSQTAMVSFNSSTTSITAEPIGNTEPSLPI